MESQHRKEWLTLSVLAGHHSSREQRNLNANESQQQSHWDNIYRLVSQLHKLFS